MEHILNEYEKTNWKRIEGKEILHIIEKLVKTYPPPSSATLGGFSSPLVYSSYLRVY
jgi:hypothetical protein